MYFHNDCKKQKFIICEDKKNKIHMLKKKKQNIRYEMSIITVQLVGRSLTASIWIADTTWLMENLLPYVISARQQSQSIDCLSGPPILCQMLLLLLPLLDEDEYLHAVILTFLVFILFIICWNAQYFYPFLWFSCSADELTFVQFALEMVVV